VDHSLVRVARRGSTDSSTTDHNEWWSSRSRGLPGVGKSSDLLAVYIRKLLLEDADQHKNAEKKDDASARDFGVVLFKWRRREEMFTCLLNGTHEVSVAFRREYGEMLLKELEASNPFPAL